ncbi:MAG TPA: tRNA (adenosine(37)-N6)-threonylcarbamoyltransferase complex dimerization subunit type 1 TsaB, partial [Terriglobia bacterium]|nr:tRNA (adenosine(37)-N6)-threonylcarbamoyltransferase complex dimerization subunit type 1 TsaB [Terriglobia bacterium]
MKLLAVDTCSGPGSLALASDDGRCELVRLPAAWKSAVLHGELQALLQRWGCRSRDLDGYAVTSGPGTFTGLRIGLTAVKALAEVHGKPVVAVSSLELLAVAGQAAAPQAGESLWAALLDARRGQIFGALFRSDGASLRAVLPDCVCSLDRFLDRVREAGKTSGIPVRFAFAEPEPFVALLRRAGWDDAAQTIVAPQLAGVLAGIGL